MTTRTPGVFWLFIAWLIKKLGLDRPKKADPKLKEFLKKKGFHFEDEKHE